MEDNNRTLGTVQWFSRVKGYGFVRPDEQEEDIFVHYSAISGEGYRNLSEGQRVEFTVEDTPKGPQAVNVIALDTGVSEGPDTGESESAEAYIPDTGESESAEAYIPDTGESESAEAYIPDTGESESAEAYIPDTGESESAEAYI